MRREGRQHGMVWTCSVHVNNTDSPPTAGVFTKVSTKPTNHSKSTGKCDKPRCNSCRIHPASKAKDKTKGRQKFKTSDVVSNHRLDGRSGLNSSGFSASVILDNLSRDYFSDDDDDDEINGS